MPPLSSLAVSLLSLTACSPTPPRPDVVLITIDTLRYDHLSANQPDSAARTPNMDRLARDGVRFTQAWSPISVTGPAFASLLTGRAVGEHGMLMNLFHGGQPLAAEQTTLAESMQAAGYRTGAFVSGFTLRSEVGLDQGFDVYDAPEVHQRRPSDRTVASAIAWLTESERPSFLWFHSYDPHGPLKRWTLPDEETRDWARGPTSTISPHQREGDIVDPDYYKAKYALAVEFADVQVGKLLASLDDAGRYEDALIILTADHGEGLDEREVWFEHGSLAYEEELHVPLLLKLPGNGRGGMVREAMVSLMDIAPTVTAALEIEPLPDVDGRHLLEQSRSQLDGESSHCKPMVFLDCAPQGSTGKMLVSRTAADTLLRKSTIRGAVYERYDRHGDPRERVPNLVEVHRSGDPVPPVAPLALIDPLEDLRRHRTRALHPRGPESDDEADPAEIEKLRALGYVE